MLVAEGFGKGAEGLLCGLGAWDKGGGWGTRKGGEGGGNIFDAGVAIQWDGEGGCKWGEHLIVSSAIVAARLGEGKGGLGVFVVEALESVG